MHRPTGLMSCKYCTLVEKVQPGLSSPSNVCGGVVAMSDPNKPVTDITSDSRSQVSTAQPQEQQGPSRDTGQLQSRSRKLREGRRMHFFT